MIKKGIILAGGKGTRQYPNTVVTSKLLLPIYDKPVIYYPLATLIDAGVNQILLITSPRHIAEFKELFGDGSKFGIELHYAEQVNPEGIAQSFVIGKDFIGRDGVCLILGDNLISSDNLNESLENALIDNDGATIFAYRVKDPTQYGVVEFDDQGKVLSLEEKPRVPKSEFAVPGLYVYDNQVVRISQTLDKSPRGEYEITDVNLAYLALDSLEVMKMSDDSIWFDVGTHRALLEASNYIFNQQMTARDLIGSVEEAAYRRGLINDAQLNDLIQKMPDVDYKELLRLGTGI